MVAQLDSDDFRWGSNSLSQSAGMEKDALGNIFCAALAGKATPKIYILDNISKAKNKNKKCLE